MTQVYRVWLAMQLDHKEAEEFRVLVREARKLGWDDASLGQRIEMGPNPSKRMDQVMKRRKSALGEHLKRLREVVNSREKPASVTRGKAEDVTSAPPARPIQVADPLPRLTHEPARERGELPDLSAAPDADRITEEEALEFCSIVEDLAAEGWRRTDIGKEIGYANENAVSAAIHNVLNEKARPPRAKLDAIRRLAMSGKKPPQVSARIGTRRPRAVIQPAPEPSAAPSVVLPAEEVPAEAVPVVLPRERPPVPMHVQLETPRRSTDSLTVLDYLERARDDARRAKKALDDAERAAKSAASRGNRWIRRGIEEDAIPHFAPLCAGLDKLIAALTLE